MPLVDIYRDRAEQLAAELGVKAPEIEFVRKGRMGEVKEFDLDERSIISYVSTKSLDRDNEIIIPKGIDLSHYIGKGNPVVLWAHDHSGLPIGRSAWIKVDKVGLRSKTIFATEKQNPLAEQVFSMMTDTTFGPFLNAWSIGFIPIEGHEPTAEEEMKLLESGDVLVAGFWSRDAEPHIKWVYDKVLLLEYSAVPVPSNPDSVNLMKTKGISDNRSIFPGFDFEDASFILNKEVDTSSGLLKLAREDRQTILAKAAALVEDEELEDDVEDEELEEEEVVETPVGSPVVVEKEDEEDPEEKKSTYVECTITTSEGDFVNIEDLVDAGVPTIPVSEANAKIRAVEDRYFEILERIEMELKDGRVLSKKNRDLVQDAVNKISEVTSALGKLLDDSTTAPEEPKPEIQSVVEPEPEKIAEEIEITRAEVPNDSVELTKEQIDELKQRTREMFKAEVDKLRGKVS